MATLSSKKCDVCLRRGVKSRVRTLCDECRDLLCKECSDEHLTHRSSMNHTLIDLELSKDIVTPCTDGEHSMKFLAQARDPQQTIFYRAQVAVDDEFIYTNKRHANENISLKQHFCADTDQESVPCCQNLVNIEGESESWSPLSITSELNTKKQTSTEEESDVKDNNHDLEMLRKTEDQLRSVQRPNNDVEVENETATGHPGCSIPISESGEESWSPEFHLNIPKEGLAVEDEELNVFCLTGETENTKLDNHRELVTQCSLDSDDIGAMQIEIKHPTTSESDDKFQQTTEHENKETKNIKCSEQYSKGARLQDVSEKRPVNQDEKYVIKVDVERKESALENQRGTDNDETDETKSRIYGSRSSCAHYIQNLNPQSEEDKFNAEKQTGTNSDASDETKCLQYDVAKISSDHHDQTVTHPSDEHKSVIVQEQTITQNIESKVIDYTKDNANAAHVSDTYVDSDGARSTESTEIAETGNKTPNSEKEENDTESNRKVFDVTESKAAKHREISVKRPADSDDVNITGILTLSDKIIVIDNNNHKVKLFDVSGRYVTSADLKASTWGITRTSEDGFATCGGIDKKVYFWAVRFQNMIYNITAFRVAQQAHAIHFSGTYFCVLHRTNKLLSILNIRGEPVRTLNVTTALPKESELGWDIHMDKDTQNIYVPCARRNSGVLCLSPIGDLLWFSSVSDCEMLFGIAEIQEHLCVADYSRNCVHLISKAGKCVKTLIEKNDLLDKPRYMCYDDDEQKLYVCYNFTCRKRDMLSVYLLTMPSQDDGCLIM